MTPKVRDKLEEEEDYVPESEEEEVEAGVEESAGAEAEVDEPERLSVR